MLANDKCPLEKLIEDPKQDIQKESFVAIKKSVQEKYEIPDEETNGTLVLFETKESIETCICENGEFEADDPVVSEIMGNIQTELGGETGDYLFQQISDLIADEISKKKSTVEESE